jgi:1,5-anhydro-D-fructose reductase (1,5-anhydro-D-mannitol-forming)
MTERGTRKAVRFVCVGLGTQAQQLARAMQETSSATLVGVVSSSRERGETFAKTYGATHIATSLKEIIALDKKKPFFDAVCVTSPNHEHVGQVLEALRAKKHVLCEKPLALSVADGRLIERTARAHGVHCFVDFQLREHPAVLLAREAIISNKIGSLVAVEMHWSIGTFGESSMPPLPLHKAWRESMEHAGGGALAARGVHLFDMLRFLTGKEVALVFAYTDIKTKKKVDTLAAGILVLTGGATATLVTSKRIPAARNGITLYGTHGRLELDLFTDDPSLTTTTVRGTVTKQCKKKNLYAAVFDSFTQGIQGIPGRGAEARDGTYAIAITEAFVRSAATKTAVMLSSIR